MPFTATLSDPTVTKRGLREELSMALKPFECATVFMSVKKYITISTVPSLVKGLVKSTQSATFESAVVQAL